MMQCNLVDFFMLMLTLKNFGAVFDKFYLTSLSIITYHSGIIMSISALRFRVFGLIIFRWTNIMFGTTKNHVMFFNKVEYLDFF